MVEVEGTCPFGSRVVVVIGGEAGEMLLGVGEMRPEAEGTLPEAEETLPEAEETPPEVGEDLGVIVDVDVVTLEAVEAVEEDPPESKARGFSRMLEAVVNDWCWKTC